MEDCLRPARRDRIVTLPENVDMGADESDNIIVDMKTPANEYEFQKLNADFDRKLDRLSDEYKRKGDEIFHADRYGLGMKKRKNRLWMWFDRKTKFRIFPKILIAVTVLTMAAIACYFKLASFPHLFGDYRPDDCMGVFILSPALVIEILCCIAVFSSGQGNQEFPIYLDVVTNPAFKDLECNVYHEKPSKHR